MKILTHYQLYGKKPYVARWYEGAHQKNRFFDSEESRAAYIKDFEQIMQRRDRDLPEMAPRQLIRWQIALAMTKDITS
jgi:hypothetical protein